MVQTTADLSRFPAAEAPAAHHRVGWGQIFLRYLRRDKVGAAAFIVFGFFVFLAIFGPMITTAQTRTDLTKIYSPPSWNHVLGTDYAGHDNFTLIVRGARSVMVVGALAAAISTAIAVTIGALSALVGGRFDA